MARVITFSRTFPSYHPRKGEPTFFVEKIWESLGDCFYDQVSKQLNDILNFGSLPLSLESFEPKHHTIRAGHRWKAGDWFSPRVWSGKPRRSKQIIIAPDIQIKKIWKFEIRQGDVFPYNHNLYGFIDGKLVDKEQAKILAMNDGISIEDMNGWFNKPFSGQIICFNENINY